MVGFKGRVVGALTQPLKGWVALIIFFKFEIGYGDRRKCLHNKRVRWGEGRLPGRCSVNALALKDLVESLEMSTMIGMKWMALAAGSTMPLHTCSGMRGNQGNLGSTRSARLGRLQPL